MKPRELDLAGTSNAETPAEGSERVAWGASGRQRMIWLRKTAREHLWGPSGSFLLHGVVIGLAVLLFRSPPPPGIPTDPILILELHPTRFDPPPPAERLPESPQDPLLPGVWDPAIEPDAPPAEPAPPLDSLRPLDVQMDVQGPLVIAWRPGMTEGGRMWAMGDSVRGNPEKYEAVVRRALEWLKEHQLPDGSWEGEGSARCKTAMTGLGLLAFLAHGETPNSESYGRTVERAIRFLVEVDAKEDGSFAHSDGAQYAHGIATYALAEAFTLTRIQSIKPVLEAAIARILAGQQSTGAFNYGLHASDSRRDTSVAGWMTQAMKAADIGGVRVAGLKEAMDLAGQGIQVNFDEGTSLFRYAPGAADGRGEGGASSSVTPIGILCLQLLGRARDPEVAAAIQHLSKWEAAWAERHPSAWPLYTWYYATQAFFHADKGEWRRWYEPFALMLVRNQNADGSWTPNGTSESAYGPVYGTVFSALTLMTPYRYLPLYRQIPPETIPSENDKDDLFAGLTALNS